MYLFLLLKRALAAKAKSAAMDPVKLIASDGTEIILDRQAAMVSGTIKSMLGGPGVGATAATSTCVTAAAAALRSDGTAPAGTADFARRCSRPPPSYRSHPATSARRALTSPRLRSGKVGMWSRRRGRSTSRRSRARRSSRRSSTFTTSSATPTRPVRLSTQLPSRTASGDQPRCLPLPPPPRPLSPPRRPRLCSQPHPPRVQNRARVGTGAADGCKLPRYMNMTSKPLRAHPAGRGPCSRCVEMPEGSRLS